MEFSKRTSSVREDFKLKGTGCVDGPTWFLGGDVERRTAGSKPGTVFCSDWDQIGCVVLQAREQSSGRTDNPHSPWFTQARAFLPEKNLGTKMSRLLQAGIHYLDDSEASLLLNNVGLLSRFMHSYSFWSNVSTSICIYICWNWGTDTIKLHYMIMSDSKSENGECMGREFVRICIHKGIIYDP